MMAAQQPLKTNGWCEIMAERLTEYDSHGDLYVKNHDYISVSHKLAQYEDLGFTPEEIVLLAKFYREHTSVSSITAEMKMVANSIELQKYKDLEEQGRLIELPCKPFEKVWIAHTKSMRVFESSYASNSDILADMEKGLIIAKTKEEAEAKLKEAGEQE